MCQIINLGAGFDTLYWRLKDSGIKVKNYIEIDFASVTSKKCFLIKKSKVLLDTISSQGMCVVDYLMGIKYKLLIFGIINIYRE